MDGGVDGEGGGGGGGAVDDEGVGGGSGVGTGWLASLQIRNNSQTYSILWLCIEHIAGH